MHEPLPFFQDDHACDAGMDNALDNGTTVALIATSSPIVIGRA